MIKTIFKFFWVFVAVVLLCVFSIFFITIIPFYSSSAIQVFFHILNPCVPTIGSIALTYRFAPKYNLIASITALFLSFIILYPSTVSVSHMLKLGKYNHLPVISMFLVGASLIFFCHKNHIGKRILERIILLLFIFISLGIVMYVYPFFS